MIGFVLRARAKALSRYLRRVSIFENEVGSALVEAAFVFPLMIMLLTGMVSFSLALYNLQQLGNATAQAVQTLGASEGITSDPCATVATAVSGVLPSWTASKFSYSVTITDSNGTAHGPYSGSSCTTYASYMAPNQPVVVTISYQYSWFSVFKFSPAWSNLSSTQAAIQM